MIIKRNQPVLRNGTCLECQAGIDVKTGCLDKTATVTTIQFNMSNVELPLCVICLEKMLDKLRK